jgi:hypothetical protein
MMDQLPPTRVDLLDLDVASGAPEPVEIKPDLSPNPFALEGDTAAYKIDVIFSSKRSSLAHVPSACVVTIWESGRHFHGGGDQKMYWCGYPDCQMPLSSDTFLPSHVVCTKCMRENFRDPVSKQQHIEYLDREGQPRNDIEKLPMIVGEKFAKLTPANLAFLLHKTWHQLDRNADIRLIYSAKEIRFDAKHDGIKTKVVDKLDRARRCREPVIYTVAAIRKDLAAGADLIKRLIALVTA